MEEETQQCDQCQEDKPVEDGDNVFNTEEEYDTWVCVDCLNVLEEKYN